MIFPGMDPYLEDPQLWTGVHAALIVYIRDYLQPRIRPRYIAAVEERVFLEGPEKHKIPDVWVSRRKRTAAREANGSLALLEPDTPVVVSVPGSEIHQPYLNILDRLSGQTLVTTLEVVSPSNKYRGPGRDLYLAKQKETRESTTHLVEIDLLRTGPHVLAVPEWMARAQKSYQYLVSVNRANGTREDFELYFGVLRERLPRVAVPLAGKDPDVVLDLQSVLEQTYEAGVYGDRINYRAACRPALSRADQVWANRLIRTAQKRSRGRGPSKRARG